MEGSQEASGGGPAEAESPKEPLGNQASGQQPPQVPAERLQPESPESSPRLARAARAAMGQDPSEEKLPLPPRPGPLRGPPLSLGYGAFRRLGSSNREPPSPGPTSAEQSRSGEASGVELMPWAEPAPGSWTPVELQVDVRVKPVGAGGSSRSPSPAPSTRFLTVPVPESPAFSRHASPAPALLQRAPSPGSTWGRGSPLAIAATDWSSPAEGRADSPDSPACRCRELGLTKEGAALSHLAGMNGQKLPRAIALIGLPMYMKSLRWALVVTAVLLAVSMVTIMALASRAGTGCKSCPEGQMWSEKHRLFLSSVDRDWEGSRAFCAAHHAMLPLLSHTQDFLRRYRITRSSWVGARRGPKGWHWIDGLPLESQLLPQDSEDHPDLSCGGLEEGELVALNCSSLRPWVCIREAE